jgi:hypothetical protein
MSNQVVPEIMLLVMSAYGAYLLLFAEQYRDWMVRRMQLPRTVLIYRVIGGVLLAGTLFMFAKLVLRDY